MIDNRNILDDGSDVLDIVAGQIPAIYVVHRGFRITPSACLLPGSPSTSCFAWSEEVHCFEPVELFEVFGSSFALKCLDHNEILTMFEGCVLKVFN